MRTRIPVQSSCMDGMWYGKTCLPALLLTFLLSPSSFFAQICSSAVCVTFFEFFSVLIHSVFTTQHFECQLPQPLTSLEAFIDDKEEYPSVCYGIKILWVRAISHQEGVIASYADMHVQHININEFYFSIIIHVHMRTENVILFFCNQCGLFYPFREHQPEHTVQLVHRQTRREGSLRTLSTAAGERHLLCWAWT